MPFKPGQGLLQDLHAVIQGLGELLFFGEQGFLHLCLQLHQLRIGIAHLLDQGRHQFVEERTGGAQLITVAYGPANDTAQYIPATFVARQHAVGDQECAGADVIGDDSQRIMFQVGDAEYARRRADQGLEQVNLIIAVHLLHDSGDALQAHAGIHRGLGQWV